MRPSSRASGLALLGATVLAAALLTNDDGSASPAATSKIAFVGARIDSRVHVELSVINADGSGKRRLVETARSGPAHERRYGPGCQPACPLPYEPYEISSKPAWSPDGRSIAFAGMGNDANVDVYVVRADGRGRKRLTRDPAVDGNPAWSPNGRKIAFTRRSPKEVQIYVMNADGSDKRRLTRRGEIHFSVAWSPDGQKMLFERWFLRYGEEIYIMNADGSGQRRLTRNPARDGHPLWTPDGRQIAFTRWTRFGRPSQRQEIWVMNPDGSGKRNLTPARAVSFNPAWSPDGRRIVFAGGSNPGFPDGIFVMDADGSEQRRLTQHGSGPAWAPDGQMIAFTRDSGAGVELHVMNADGSGERRLMRAGVRWAVPFAWSPALPNRP